MPIRRLPSCPRSEPRPPVIARPRRHEPWPADGHRARGIATRGGVAGHVDQVLHCEPQAREWAAGGVLERERLDKGAAILGRRDDHRHRFSARPNKNERGADRMVRAPAHRPRQHDTRPASFVSYSAAPPTRAKSLAELPSTLAFPAPNPAPVFETSFLAAVSDKRQWVVQRSPHAPQLAPRQRFGRTNLLLSTSTP